MREVWGLRSPLAERFASVLPFVITPRFQSSTDKCGWMGRGRALWVGSNYFVRLLRFFRIGWHRRNVGCGLGVMGKFTLEEISALLGTSELQSVTDCLMETTLETVSAGWNWNQLEPKPGIECL
jgi:hypothetical protein